jgi:hypothetical protein
VLFLPDEHLGRNTGYRMGIPLDEMIVWDPYRRAGRKYSGTDRASQGDFVEGLLLRAPAIHAGACG